MTTYVQNYHMGIYFKEDKYFGKYRYGKRHFFPTQMPIPSKSLHYIYSIFHFSKFVAQPGEIVAASDV